MKIALNKRIRSLELYLRNNCSFTAFKAKWKILYQGELLPSRKYMQRLLKKFRMHGDLNNIKRNRKNTTRRNDIVTDISAFYQMNQGTSLRNFIREENPGISLSTLRNILREDLGLKPFKCRRFHHLHGQSDFNKRYEMCRTFLELSRSDSTLSSKIIWTDECYMKLNGIRNHHNIYWWATENPHIYVEKSLNDKGVMVFVGITAYGPIGPYFFDELRTNAGKKNKNSVSGPSYHELLVTKVLPELKELFPQDMLNTFIFQLDGAPGHRTSVVTNCLNNVFPNRWWGNGGPIHWAPRSPDLSPLGKFNLISFVSLIFF